jgi:CARDB
MRKIACTAGLLLATLVAAGPATAQTVPTKGTLEACHTGADALARYAIFSAQVGKLPATKTLQIRFDLLQRLPGTKAFAPIAAPGLGVWSSSTRDVYRYRKTVAGLQAPGAYRAVVRFRWLGSRGVQRTARRRTAICTQPDPGVNLLVGAVRAQSAGSGRSRYLVTIRNSGRADAGAFDVGFALGDAEQPVETVEGLGAGASTTVSFMAPTCASGDQITLHVDPEGRVQQTDRTDDQKVVDCPIPPP